MRTILLGLALATSAGAATAENLKTAVIAGGCFWCVESDYDKLPGVVETISGYAGGTTDNPTYEQVTQGGSGHYEVVQVTYDADIVSYRQLIDVFWRSVDPTDGALLVQFVLDKCKGFTIHLEDSTGQTDPDPRGNRVREADGARRLWPGAVERQVHHVTRYAVAGIPDYSHWPDEK